MVSSMMDNAFDGIDKMMAGMDHSGMSSGAATKPKSGGRLLMGYEDVEDALEFEGVSEEIAHFVDEQVGDLFMQ